ncbi:hypothetical protein BJV82DRAFT_644574 [Fennellomyces sp. T-0311]|nr:hypothetical protein BJV82DRAFT_644574 [Fennellomyces sp. T-0311]
MINKYLRGETHCTAAKATNSAAVIKTDLRIVDTESDSRPPSAISREVLKPSAQSSAQAESSKSTGHDINKRPDPPRPKSTQPLRSSKISQKLVLFPPRSIESSAAVLDNALPLPAIQDLSHQKDQQAWTPQEWTEDHQPTTPGVEIPATSLGCRTEAEHMTQDERDLANLSRVTAYCTGEGYALSRLRQFLRQHHRVTPRLYDECLYAAYHYPLHTMRPGKENLHNVRVRSASPRANSLSDEGEMDYDEDTYERNGIEAIGSHLRAHDRDDCHEFSRRMTSISAPASPVKDDDVIHRPITLTPAPPQRRDSLFTGGEVFLFDYGVVVFWNFNRAQELLMLEDFAQFSIRPFRDNPDEEMQIEEMHFQYDVSQVKPRIFNDMITLKSKMAQTGRLVKNRTEITKVNGQLFNLRMNVNLVSNVLDTPEIFWSEPALQPMYNAIRDYLEIPQRAKILNDRLKVISDLLSMLRDHLTNFGVEYQTLIIIYLIIIAVIVACFEIAVKVLQTMRVI